MSASDKAKDKFLLFKPINVIGVKKISDYIMDLIKKTP